MNMSLLLRIPHLRILVMIGVTISLLATVVPALAQSGERPRAPELYTPSTTHDTVKLFWWETADPAVLGITYEVQRRNGRGWNVVNGVYGQIRTYSDGSVTIPFTDSSVSPDTNYTYRVYAIKGDLRSSSSRRILAITEPAPERYVAPVSTPEPTPEPTAEPTPAPTAEPTPENQDVGNTPQQQVPVDDQPQQQVPVVDQPQQQVPVDDQPQQQVPVDDQPQQQVPVDDQPQQQVPVDDQPQQQVPDDDNGIDEVVQNNNKPDKIEELDGGGEDPVIDGPSLTRTTATSTSITLEWDAPTGATPTGYRIWMKTGETVFSYQFYGYNSDRSPKIIATLKVSDTSTTSGDTATSETITVLASNTMHHFWVAALYGTGTKTQGLISPRMSLRTDPTVVAPSAVRNVQVTDLPSPSNSLRVSWNAAEANTTPGCAVDGHTVAKWSIGGDTSSRNIGNVLLYDWSESYLRPDDTYVFSVTARCGAVTGERATVTFTTDPAATLPPMPVPHLSNSTATQVTLKWYTPQSPKVNNWGFEIERMGGGADWSVVTGTYAGGSSTTPGGFQYGNGGFATIWYDRTVSADTFYTYRIATVDSSNNKSAPSTRVTAQTLIATSTGTPGAPLNVRTGLVLTNPNKVRIMWDPPDDRGSSDITGYQILRNNSVVIANTGTLLTTYDDSVVEEGQFSIYRVRAINSQGGGLRSRITSSSAIRFSVNPPPGTTVHTRPARSGSAMVEITNDTANSDSTVRVKWTDGTATSRVCHTDYYLIYGILQDDSSYKYQFGSPGVTSNPDISIAGRWYLMNYDDPVGPYKRGYEQTLARVWTTSATPGTGETTLNWKLKVYCGHPAASDSVEIAEATPSIVTAFTITVL